MDVLTSLLDI